MEKIKNRHLLTIFVCSLFLFLSAGEVHAVLIHINAGNAGLKLQYNLKRWGSEDVTLAPGDPETQLTLRRIAGRLVQLWIQVDSIDASTPIPVVNAVIKTVIMGNSNTYPITLPFGDYGIEANFFKRTRLTAHNTPIEISLEFGLLSTDYDITLNLGSAFNHTYKGSATLRNNVIHEQIPLIGDNMTAHGSIDLTIIPVKTIPLTFFIYSGGVYDDNNTLVQPLSGVIPLPNGTYQLWLDPGFDIPDLFGPQACCMTETMTCKDNMTAAMCTSAGGFAQGMGTTCSTVTCSSDNSSN